MQEMLKQYERSFFERILEGKNEDEFYLLFHTGEKCGPCIKVLDAIEELPDKIRNNIISVPRGYDVWIGLAARFKVKDYPAIVYVGGDICCEVYMGYSIFELIKKWRSDAN